MRTGGEGVYPPILYVSNLFIGHFFTCKSSSHLNSTYFSSPCWSTLKCLYFNSILSKNLSQGTSIKLLFVGESQTLVCLSLRLKCWHISETLLSRSLVFVCKCQCLDIGWERCTKPAHSWECVFMLHLFFPLFCLPPLPLIFLFLPPVIRGIINNPSLPSLVNIWTIINKSYPY